MSPFLNWASAKKNPPPPFCAGNGPVMRLFFQLWWIVAKDNYRESEALTKKMMGLKGKGESKTVAWRSRGIKGKM